MSKKKVILGLSGGVDSSVAAYLLLQEGYDVEALFMKNWEDDDSNGHCAAEDDLADAKAVCQKLGIVLHSVNFSAEYWDNVFTYFLDEYRAGRTPNPDILCNKEIKFKAFLDYALELGADYIATGHYVKSRYKDGDFELLKGSDRNKDQSYFLYAIAPEALGKSLFPIGELEKSKVREIALEQGLITHNKKDSTGICFIGERKFSAFLKEYLLAQTGEIKTLEGKVIGQHDGLMYYTYGQRQGLNIGGLKGAEQAPWYVVDKDIEKNTLIVAQGKHHPRLYAKGLMCSKLHWLPKEQPSFPLQCTAKTRYRQEDQHCLITKTGNDEYCVMFIEEQRAITPGQSIVFYDKYRCLGGAVIDSFIR